MPLAKIQKLDEIAVLKRVLNGEPERNDMVEYFGEKLLQWSFVRNDQPRATTAMQIALALRDEVGDLEKAGIGMIQIDDPAFREGLPHKRRDRPQNLDWAVRAFKISVASVAAETQIHAHRRYPDARS